MFISKKSISSLCDLDMNRPEPFDQLLKRVIYCMIIPAKFGQNPASTCSLGGDVF